MSAAPRIIIYGGTFDPPHRAHVELPLTVLRQLGADSIIYVPTCMNPLKDDRPTSGAARVAMLEAALAGIPEASVSAVELSAGAPSYTIDTLERLVDDELDGADVYLLLGADAVADVVRWKRWQDIAALATPVIMLRQPWTEETLRLHLVEQLGTEQAKAWTRHVLDPGPLDIIATELRDRLATGEVPVDLLPPGVAEYIRASGLYATG